MENYGIKYLSIHNKKSKRVTKIKERVKKLISQISFFTTNQKIFNLNFKQIVDGYS